MNPKPSSPWGKGQAGISEPVLEDIKHSGQALLLPVGLSAL
jgi:hypothetical protein